MKWAAKIRIKHLLTQEDDLESIQASMNAIADVLQQSGLFSVSFVSKFRNIKEDSVVSAEDYANILLDKMYDYADARRIWIE